MFASRHGHLADVRRMLLALRLWRREAIFRRQLPGLKDRSIIAGSFSKTFAMTGWRLGYTLAPKPLIDAMTKLQSQSTSNPTSIAQYAGLAAMRSMDSVPACWRNMRGAANAFSPA